MSSEQTLYEFYINKGFNPQDQNIDTELELRTHIRQRQNLYVNKLGLHDFIWRNSQVLEIGCCSGEKTLLLAKHGAQLTLVEPVKEFLDNLQSLFEKHHLSGSIHAAHNSKIESLEFKSKFDIVIAEGFIYTMLNRVDVIRSIFELVTDGGLLITSTNDPVGYFIEFFKGVLSRVYCKKREVHDINEQVNLLKPFFYDAYNSIPHSRTFDAWIKDGIICHLNEPDRFYSFDEMVHDLYDLKPHYYSSWPSYKHANDLLWHKNLIQYDEHLKQAIDGYTFRQPSFILGECMDEEDSMSFLINNNSIELINNLKEIMRLLSVYERQEDDVNLKIILDVFKTLKTHTSNSQLLSLFNDMQNILLNFTPETYLDTLILKDSWGVPYHYIVFRKEGD